MHVLTTHLVLGCFCGTSRQGLTSPKLAQFRAHPQLNRRLRTRLVFPSSIFLLPTAFTKFELLLQHRLYSISTITKQSSLILNTSTCHTSSQQVELKSFSPTPPSRAAS
ncbi:hypothetical protein CI102_11718 [Trichoderma harzianum]|uniref:Uncharacterized protein n=1 Tax=Trichoderma harzianum CBS 226.95 TaxID=983964 RepID=A0A2T4A5L0_TRIHA|nr:hypothetical protein M431DRAFT_216051 [Trichoderma harzianum CBS 226.95]PKK44151.1 hypothetical protein CI102_11718 [Trichoderma harzianum]PTB52360.1 hypothetical protein M431DRAFT_216051 [Trichoderma harzianum CBS 226.95]